MCLPLTSSAGTLLFTMSQPGGPFYAPRKVRHAAVRTFDAIYPRGRRLRWLFKTATAMLHPFPFITTALNAGWSALSAVGEKVVNAWERHVVPVWHRGATVFRGWPIVSIG